MCFFLFLENAAAHSYKKGSRVIAYFDHIGSPTNPASFRPLQSLGFRPEFQTARFGDLIFGDHSLHLGLALSFQE
jgi:hypothetical protein